MPISLRSRTTTFFRRCRRRLAKFVRRENGSVAIYTAVTMVVMIACVGIAVDTARAFLLKSKLSQALDAAALAGGKVLLSSNLEDDINMFFRANFPAGFMDATLDGPHIEQPTAATSTTLTVSANATMPTIFGAFLGLDTVTVAASTEVTRALSALDVVLSIDMSGSMAGYDGQVRDAANDLVDILFAGATKSPELAIGPDTFQLLHIGLVPWNAKVNITGKTTNSLTSVTVPAFTNPVTKKTQTTLWKSTDTPVTLLNDPTNNSHVDWKGCVYARYVGDDDQTNDADLELGYPTMHGATWLGWEGIKTSEGIQSSCAQRQWNNKDISDPNPARPDPWYIAVPSINNGSCSACYAQGITRLKTVKSDIVSAINKLTNPAGGTNITQGLFWAYQVLMPGDPFNDALPDDAIKDKFPRNRAIVLLTDGQNNGENGDAYKGRFGSGTDAGTNSHSAHGQLASAGNYWPAGQQNNLNNRLLKLAASIKGPSAVRIYIIQFRNTDTATTTLLQTVASGKSPPYFFKASDSAGLKDAFKQIAADLSTLRLTQ